MQMKLLFGFVLYIFNNYTLDTSISFLNKIVISILSTTYLKKYTIFSSSEKLTVINK